MEDASEFFDHPGLEDSMHAKELCFEYNSTRPSDTEKRKKIIRKLFGSIGNMFEIRPPFQCDYGYNIKAGNNVFINHNCVILDCEEVTIGDNVLIGPNCGIYAAAHPLDASKRFTGEDCDLPVKIGNDVWVGGNVVILAGVTIGDNVIIGAGSVVNRNIPSNTVAAGNPCRIIRKIPEL